MECLVVAVAGALLAFAANALSPRGLKSLTRNYFPADYGATNTAALTNRTGTASQTTAPSVLEVLKHLGLQGIDSNQVAQLYNDPRRTANLLAFVDARSDDHYQQGHIPGAYQLDWYRPDNYVAALLTVSQIAQEFVVYCNGGECDDSIKAATFLRDSLRVSNDKIRVYTGGFAEWSTNRMPVELGDRNSGNLRPK